MKVKLLVGLLLLFLLSACTGRTGEERAVELTVFAAASLADAFTELGVAFTEQNPQVNVVFNFAGSSQLAAQISEGAVVDVFASANRAQMAAAVNNGRIAAGSDLPFVSNRLTLIVPADNPAAIAVLEDLAQPGIWLILAVPGVPVRQYTDEIVAEMGNEFAAAFYHNLASEEANVRQVAAKVALGEADAGIVYTSDVTPDLASRVQQIEIPAAQNVIATYPIAPLIDAPQPELARQFIEFTLSSAGQAVLSRWGFGPPLDD
jgi:molybdate transport system substrate-binding protein